jgi:hypothetical protein
MMLAIILVVAAALALMVILGLTVSRSLQISRGTVSAQIQAIDVEAFRNLANPAETEYLRRRLPAGEFRAVERARLQAMACYIQTAGRNAAILIQIGQRALSAADPQTSDAARALVENALLLRRNAAFALMRIYVGRAWPNWGPTATPVLREYEQLSGSAMLLGRLQNPGVPVRISSVS